MDATQFQQGLQFLERLTEEGQNENEFDERFEPVANAMKDAWLAAVAAPEVLVGVLMEISGDELAEHLAARAAYHKEKASFYAAKVNEQRALQPDPLVANISNNPIQSLEQSTASHRQRQAFFGFMADHLVKNAVYRQTEVDLTKLELLDRYL